jgi:hypothetical protein
VAETRRRVASGYNLVLPPGWCRIPLRGGTSAAIRKLLDERFRHLPRDTVAPYRIEIERRLKEQVVQARNNGGIDMYFPVEIADSGPVPASFVVSEIRLELPENAGDNGPALVLASLAADGSRIVDVDGAPGVRAEELVPGDPDAELAYGSRRVKYLIPVPGTPGRWLAVAFATPGAADPGGKYAGLLVELFDAIMTTFRWTDEGQ